MNKERLSKLKEKFYKETEKHFPDIQKVPSKNDIEIKYENTYPFNIVFKSEKYESIAVSRLFTLDHSVEDHFDLLFETFIQEIEKQVDKDEMIYFHDFIDEDGSWFFMCVRDVVNEGKETE